LKTKEVVSIILEAEKKSNVFNLKHKEKYLVWPFYRMYFFYEYLNQKTETGELGFKASKINISRFKDFLILLCNSKLHRLFYRQNKDNLIISTQRYVGENEIYTKDLKDLSGDNFLDISFSNRFIFRDGPIYLDFIKIVLKLISRVSHYFFNAPNEVKHFFSIVDADKSCEIQYKRYRIEYSLWFFIYDVLIKIQKPKRIFLTDGIYLSPLIAVAEKYNIEVIEMQHGVINKYHLAFHFPDQKRNTYFPHKLLMFSDYWKSKATYPEGTELISTGNDFFFYDFNKDKENKTILIIGNGLLYNQFLSFLKLNINFFEKNDYKITYKLHPAEIPGWETRYKELKELNDSKRIEVITDESSIAILIKKSEFVIGVNSTSIYESLDAGCKVIILDLQSAEYFDDLIKSNIIKKKNPLIPISTIDFDFTQTHKQTIRFFDPSNRELIKTILETLKP